MVWYTVNGAQWLSGHTRGSSQDCHGILLQRWSTNHYKCWQPDARSHCMCGYSFTLIFISSPKFRGYSKFHLNIIFMDARKTFISPHRVGFRNSFHLIRTLTFCGTNPAWLNTHQIQRRILLSECRASSSWCLLLCVRERWEGRKTCICLDLL
jgi:hypothetical protein